MRFGTDGLRGLAGAELTPEVALALGRAAARVLPGERWYVGRDPRLSGGLLQAALSAGLAAAGADVVDLGVVPTPAVAHLSERDGVPAAMVSASHNPFPDNGIKLFVAGGRKLSAEVEAAVEEALEETLAGGPEPRTGLELGSLSAAPALVHAWAQHVVGSTEGRALGPRRLVVDTAHGAACGLAPRVFAALGCEVVSHLGADPNGTNINDGCGSTHLGGLAAAVVAAEADLGVAFDGDADRCLMVDHRGEVVDGDQLLAVLALDLHEQHRLCDDVLVVTVMSNLGLHLAMADAGVRLEVTPVGDRHVLDRLDEGGYDLGGEQSGHVILRRHATTGDGLLTAVQVLDVLRRQGSTLAEAASVVRRLPQVLLNVTVAPGGRERLADAAEVHAVAAAVEAELAGHGRVLLRPSGTEPLVRVMVEAPTDEQAAAAAERVAAAVRSSLADR